MTQPTDDISALLADQRSALTREPRRALSDRRRDLAALETLVLDNADAFAEAISLDFGNRSVAETTLIDIAPTAHAARTAYRHLADWMADRRVSTPPTLAPARSRVRYEPKGAVGIVSPWNYPVQLALVPAVAALAAGCRVMIKPSELTPGTSSLLKRLLGEIFSEDQVAVVTGGADVGVAFCAQPFDHLLYTGSTIVGRSVARAAAPNLTPVTLELGGKSPVIVDADYPLDQVVHPLAWGRFVNGGQTCVAPDYVLSVGRDPVAFGEAVITQAAKFWPDPLRDPDYTSIVSERHWTRLQAMVDEARARGVRVLQAPHDGRLARSTRRLVPTVLIDPPGDLAAMREEIFGPILPILSQSTIDQAIAYVTARDHPLALYLFSGRDDVVRRVLDTTRSGGVTLNATMLHLGNENLPFGGVGASGHGAYHGRRGFEEFSHARSVLSVSAWHPSRLIAPPYGLAYRFISRMALRM